MNYLRIVALLPFALLYSGFVFAEIVELDDDDMSDIAAQSGLSIKLTVEGASDIYLAGKTNGVLSLNGIQLRQRDSGTGVISTVSSAVTTEVDVDATEGVVISTTFDSDAALVLDSIKLSANTAAITSAPSLGRLAVVDITGAAIIKVRSR